MSGLAPALTRFGLELDCVEIGQNYKVNRSDTKEGVLGAGTGPRR